MYVGQLTHNSKIRRVEEKAAKNQVKTAQVSTFETEKVKQMVLTYCTINFAKFEDMEAFEKEYKDAVESLPKPVKWTHFIIIK